MLAPVPLALVGFVVAVFVAREQSGWLSIEDSLAYFVYAVLALGVVRACRKAGTTARVMVGETPRSIRDWSLVALAVPLLSIAVATMPIIVSLIAWIAPAMLERRIESPIDITGVHGMIGAIIIAPVVEELVFRGVLLHAFAARWGVRTGVIASAVVFGVLHFDVLGAIASGVVMSLLYMRTRSLLVPMVCHALHNGMIILAEPWMQDDGTGIDVAEARAAWWIGVLGVIGAAIIFTALVRRLRPEEGWKLPSLIADR
jgi:uncharacterized protein